jgi:hypothetical protein
VIIAGNGLQKTRMIQCSFDFLLAVETIGNGWVDFYLWVQHLNCNRMIRAEVSTAKDSGHIAAGNNAINAVMIEMVAGIHSKPRSLHAVAAVALLIDQRSTSSALGPAPRIGVVFRLVQNKRIDNIQHNVTF